MQVDDGSVAVPSAVEAYKTYQVSEPSVCGGLDEVRGVAVADQCVVLCHDDDQRNLRFVFYSERTLFLSVL